MGTKLAPSFANIFMGWFENTYVYTYTLKPLIWKRYIDDIFIIWQHGADELNKLVEHLNSKHHTIKFTAEHSKISINFLDVTVTLNNDGDIITSLYCKPTDSHNYLLYSSEHPRHLLRGIPYSQFLRVRRICSNILDFRQNSLMLATHFIRRGYPHKLISEALKRAESQHRPTLIAQNAPDSTPKIKKTHDLSFYLVVTHNPGNPPITNIVRNNWALVEKSKTTRFLTDANLVFGTRRNKNLSDHLVRASTKTTKTNIIPPHCNRTSTCRYCPKINKTGTLVSTHNSRKYQSMIKVTCQSSNLIYVITCKTCGIQYVGQTKNRLLTRFQGHIFDITHNTDTTVARHLNTCPPDNPALTDGLVIMVISFIPSHPDSRDAKQHRDREEKRWMHRLQTITPQGLNLMD